MDFRIELESYLELGPEDVYAPPCKEARMVRNLCIYPDCPEKYDEPVFEVTLSSLEDLTALVSEVGINRVGAKKRTSTTWEGAAT